jgi:hypothetical protein
MVQVKQSPPVPTAETFHLYKAGAKDVIVTLDDRKTPVFFFEYPFAWFSFNIKIHAGGSPSSPLVGRIVGNTWEFVFEHFASGASIGFTRRAYSRKCEFRLGGVQYAWKTVPCSRELVLLRYPDKEEMACFSPAFSMTKLGRIQIQPAGIPFADIILGSAYIVLHLGDRARSSSLNDSSFNNSSFNSVGMGVGFSN